MAVYVQPFTLLIFRYAQANGHIGNLVTDKGDDAGPDNGDTDAFQLYQNLMAHGDAFRVAHTAQRSRGEDTGQDATYDTADAVDAKHIARVINAQPAFQNGDAPQTRKARSDTHNQRAADANVATGRSDADQTGNRP